ncbi:FecR family protein [Olivibacter sp. XZL3]|uniref:FecR family protein n=1 Tax=Olivibacter sp. XZL3 TaxID=1735116 RepID=UPI0010668CC4|nr:FecR family protein [Olivibacter sp. XZL3]
MKFSVYKSLLKRYHAGEGSDVEKRLVEVWYDSFENTVPEEEALPTEEGKRRVKARLSEHLTGSCSERPTLKKDWSRRFRPWLEVAAAIVLLLGGAWWLLDRPAEKGTVHAANVVWSVSTRFTTGPGEQRSCKLPDGSTVTLNANSALDVRKEYGREQRTVFLQGEAFFDVKPQTQSPFFVRTDDLLVQVLGTSFNVKAYNHRQKVEVAVSTGKVQISDKAKGQTFLLRKDEGYSYDLPSKQFTKLVGNSNAAWREGTVALEQVSFSELALAFRDVYGVSLQSNDSIVRNNHYTLKLKYNRNASQTIRIICHMLNKQYRKEANGDLSIF